jgi:hypothetical protein
MRLLDLLRRGLLLCALGATAGACAQVCDWCYTLQTGSRTDRIILAGGGETVTWSTARVNGEVDHWVINFNAGAATIECRPDPNDSLRGTWSEIGGLGNCQTGTMFLVEGDYGTAVYFETSCGTYLSFFETDVSNLEMVGLYGERLCQLVCLCWPGQPANCTHEQCDNAASCGNPGGGCQWRQQVQIRTEPI